MKFVMLFLLLLLLVLHTMEMQIDWLDDVWWFVMLIMLMNKPTEGGEKGSEQATSLVR